MDGDLFSKLFELFNQPGPINWKLAEEVASHLSGGPEPIDPWVAEEYQDLGRLAAAKVAEGTPLDPGFGEMQPVDRRTWARHNLRGFRYLFEPLAEKMTTDVPAEMGAFAAFLRPLGPALLGLQLGTMVGFLSHRVLGQFDVGLPTGEGDELLMVVPNVETFARSHELEVRQVRLWVALHEVTHRAEFAVPWVRPHFVSLIERYIGSLEMDPTVLSERLQALSDPEAVQRLFEDPSGLTSLFVTDAQRPLLAEIQAFMAVIEGYADFVMDRVARPLLPDIDRMREAMARRRAEPSEAEQLLSRLLGLELKREQYRLGASFFTELERRWGDEAIERLWSGPDHLPALAELSDPVGWAARAFLPPLD